LLVALQQLSRKYR